MKVVARLQLLLALPALIGCFLSDRSDLIDADVVRWAKVESRSTGPRRTLLDLVVQRRAFRTLLHHRLSHGNAAGKILGRAAFVLLPRERTLFLNTEEIGPGLYIQHGFATTVGARRIGARVWINQQVTIGVTVTDEKIINRPTIEDGATIYAGAQVIGPVRIGRDATVGAGAVVTKDVPDGMVAVGVPAVVRKRGRNARSRD
jgi:serine O-acetyltransferase